MSEKAKNYEIGYPGSRYGLMKCGTCGNDVNPPGIEPQFFAVRETPERYIVQHRECLKGMEDKWAKHDREAAKEQARQKEFQADCQAFYAKWGVSDFTDEITD